MEKGIFITGASSGLGKAAAKLFAAKGWKVIATMRKPENETELNLLDNVTLLALDVTNPEEIKKCTQSAIAQGDIDVVFNNAGYGLAGPMEAITDEQLVREVDTNLLGVIRVTRAFIPYFREKKRGLFISTTSIGGLVAFPFFSVYHATKWGLEGWSESMAFELKQFGIGIKTISPGSTKTDFAGRSLDVASQPEYDQLYEDYMKAFLSPEVMKSLCTPEQIADVVFEAATDGKDKLRYVAGADAQAAYARRLEIGDEAFRKEIDHLFFNN